jgi:hypothetical protein
MSARKDFNFRWFLVLFFLVIGGVLIFVGCQNFILLQKGTSTPTEVPLTDLTVEGAKGNLHVSLKDFRFADGYVISVNQKDKSWRGVWLVAVPSDGRVLRRPVVIRNSKLRSEGEVQGFVNAQTLTGYVTNDIESLGTVERNYLNQIAPATNLDNAIVVAIDDFPTRGFTYRLLGFGMAFLIFAAGQAVYIVRSGKQLSARDKSQPSSVDRQRQDHSERRRGERQTEAQIVEARTEEHTPMPTSTAFEAVFAIIALILSFVPFVGALVAGVSLIYVKKDSRWRGIASSAFYIGVGIVVLIGIAVIWGAIKEYGN